MNVGEGALARPGLVASEGGPEKFFGVARNAADGDDVVSFHGNRPVAGRPGRASARRHAGRAHRQRARVRDRPWAPGQALVGQRGITFAACDLVAQAALLAAGGPAQAASIRVAYPRPVPLGATPRFQARLLHRGRALGIVAVTVSTEDAKPRAIATVTTGPPG